MALKIERILRVLGLCLVIIYVITATGIINLPFTVARTSMFFLGPFAIIGITLIANKFNPLIEFKLFKNIGYIFLVIAFSLFTLMLVVQQSGFTFFEINKEKIINSQPIFDIINSVQLGMDISFDIFYCLGILFFSIGFFKKVKLNLFIGIFGIMVSLGLLTLNMLTFPYPPSDKGLIDLGPFTIIWWVLLVYYFKNNPMPKETMKEELKSFNK
jgi:hypothetical protein